MLDKLHLSQLVDSHGDVQDLVLNDSIFVQDLKSFVLFLILKVVELHREGG